MDLQRNKAPSYLWIIPDALFKETNPIPVKEALNILGFDFGEPRLPLIKCSENLKKELIKLVSH